MPVSNLVGLYKPEGALCALFIPFDVLTAQADCLEFCVRRLRLCGRGRLRGAVCAGIPTAPKHQEHHHAQ